LHYHASTQTDPIVSGDARKLYTNLSSSVRTRVDWLVPDCPVIETNCYTGKKDAGITDWTPDCGVVCMAHGV